AACGFGGDDDDGPVGLIEWHQGTPPPELAMNPPVDGEAEPTESVTVTEEIIEEPVQETPQDEPIEAPAPPPEPTAEPSPTAAPEVQIGEADAPVTGTVLTPEELELYQPNELGYVPVLMYHNILPELDPSQENDVLWRTIDDLKADLQWLYD